jgi:hypothetical protein
VNTGRLRDVGNVKGKSGEPVLRSSRPLSGPYEQSPSAPQTKDRAIHASLASAAPSCVAAGRLLINGSGVTDPTLKAVAVAVVSFTCEQHRCARSIVSEQD